MDSLAYILNNIKTCIHGLFREICFLGPRDAFFCGVFHFQRMDCEGKTQDKENLCGQDTDGGSTSARWGHRGSACDPGDGTGSGFASCPGVGPLVTTPLRTRRGKQCP